LEGLTLSEFPEVAFNILAHYIVVLTNRASRWRRVFGLLWLLADGLLIWPLGVVMVVIVHWKLCSHTDTCYIFAVGLSYALDGVLHEVLVWKTVACLAVAVIGMGAA
jgi:hypothetical protein